ncbi:MAG: hypothetical protein K0S65_543 [Labilithrix sp.]|nr:hypothetical protein [Labilithrix sp.]
MVRMASETAETSSLRVSPLATVDAIRARTLRVLAPLAPSLLRDRDRRVVVHGAIAITFAFVLTFAAPMVLLAFGPLVLGVPHLVADIRYLVARPGLHRRAGFWLLVAGPACLSFFYPHASVALAGIAGGAIAARAPWPRRAALALAGLAFVLAADRLGRIADVALAHAHNAIAVALFWGWARRRSRMHLLVVLGFVVGLAAIGLGMLDGAPVSRFARSDLLDANVIADALAPLSDPVMADRLVLAFAFAQSVHYAVWVRLVPEVDRPRPGLRSFASSLQALVEDFGAPLVVLAGLVTMGLVVWACRSLVEARDGYLRLAIFHGPLELGAATLLLLERGRIRSGSLQNLASARAVRS